DKVSVAHGLEVRTHDAECEFASAVAHPERRNDGIHRSLGRADRIRMIGVDHEAGAPIVQQDPALFRCDPGAEFAEQRIDEGYRHAIAINHREIDRIAARHWRAWVLYPLAPVDHSGKLARKALIEQR